MCFPSSKVLRNIRLGTGLLAAVLIHSAACVAEPRQRFLPPALYTEGQAAVGSIAYYQNCAMCHGPLLDGPAGGYPAPALRGPEFADPGYHFHLADIFKTLAMQMPAAKPGSLSPQVYVAIMAFLLKQNGYPAGPRELTYEAAASSHVPMLFYAK